MKFSWKIIAYAMCALVDGKKKEHVPFFAYKLYMS